MWVISNPNPSATGCPHPRPNPAEGRNELQLGGYDFIIATEAEIAEWRMWPAFVHLEEDGLIKVYETNVMPKRKPELPDAMKPGLQYDASVAKEIAISPNQQVSMDRIEVFRADPKTGKQWVDNANTPYLKTRHRELLVAAQWYLENYVGDRTKDQEERLKACKRQIKAIDQLV